MSTSHLALFRVRGTSGGPLHVKAALISRKTWYRECSGRLQSSGPLSPHPPTSSLGVLFPSDLQPGSEPEPTDKMALPVSPVESGSPQMLQVSPDKTQEA